MDRQVVRRDDVTLLRKRSQIDPSSSPQEQVDDAAASLADEMIMLAGLGVVSSCLFIQEERADFALLDETVKVAIHRGEADSRQLFVHPPVDLMGDRMGVIALESREYLFQLTRSTFAGGPSHRLPRIPDRIDRQWLRHIKSSAACQVVFGLRVLSSVRYAPLSDSKNH